MKSKITSILAIALLFMAIAFPLNSAFADTNNADTAKQAATEVTKETGAKEQFGQSSNGDRLLDQAKAKANKKLNDLAEEANSTEDLPDSKKLFLKNLNNE